MVRHIIKKKKLKNLHKTNMATKIAVCGLSARRVSKPPPQLGMLRDGLWKFC